MSDCRFGVSPVNYRDPDPDPVASCLTRTVTVTDPDCNVGEERNI